MRFYSKTRAVAPLRQAIGFARARRFAVRDRPGEYTVRVSSNYETNRQPVANEIRVHERDGRRLLQQWKLKSDGHFGAYEWVDVTELAPLPPTVRPFGADR
jgi:hypothetical protein